LERVHAAARNVLVVQTRPVSIADEGLSPDAARAIQARHAEGEIWIAGSIEFVRYVLIRGGP